MNRKHRFFALTLGVWLTIVTAWSYAVGIWP